MKVSLDSVIDVDADINMIDTVIRNLLNNAIKFTNENGTIEISTSVKEKELVLSVKDSGVGINKTNQDKLFRLDSSYSTYGTNNESGSGIGLILCKEFIERHGGKIYIESKEGEGTTISFSLLLANNDAQSKEMDFT